MAVTDPFAEFDTAPPEPRTERTKLTDKPASTVPDPSAAAAADAALTAAADAYARLLPSIEAATPERGRTTVDAPLSGVAYAVDAWKRLLNDSAALGEFMVPPFTRIDAGAGDGGCWVCAHFIDPATVVQGAEALLAMAAQRGNLGTYEVVYLPEPGAVTLTRIGIVDTTGGWREQSQTRAFYANPAYRRDVWRQVGLADHGPLTPTFGSDDRGGTASLKLPPGLLPAKVQAAEAALRQALGCAELTVTVDGLKPVIHLNTKPIVREFPTRNPLRPTLFTRPRNEPERYAAAPDFVLPLGVTADGTPLLIPQDKVPHMAIFGGTGAGKTVLLTSIIEAACLQSAEVILADAKAGRDFRRLAGEARAGRLPGVVHYAAGSDAALHRAVLYAHDELERRKALAARLSQRGIEYRPTPMLLVFDEAPAWLDACLSGSDKEAKKAAEATIARLSYLAAQAREMRGFLLIAGQHSYVSAFSGKLRSNTSTLAVLGPPTQNHLVSLFDGERRDDVKRLGATVTRTMKGRGVVVDQETGDVTLFQGFFTPPGRDADALASALSRAPKLRRFGIRFPRPPAAGGDGTWQSWSPVSDPSSDELPVLFLDDADGQPDPAVKLFDPADPAYDPGVAPVPMRHLPDTERSC